MTKQYRRIGMGGTFDHLHRGHRSFITFAESLAGEVLIGVTVPEMTRQKLFKQIIEPFEVRNNAVKDFCSSREITAQIVPLHDVFGPTITSTDIDALAVTEETVSGGVAINAERKRVGLPELPVHVFPLVLDEDGNPINSTRIRAGEIDREGQIYAKLLTNDITLTDAQRAYFAEPRGPLVATAPTTAATLTYVVGDVCVDNFHKNNWQFHAGWFDGKTQRLQNQTQISVRSTYTITNPPGQISAEATTALLQILKSQGKDWSRSILPQETTYTFVVGEEDLCAVALVLLAPLETLVYYGQPNQGMVVLNVTEELKKSVSDTLLSV